jgi:hypothetical protein
MIIREQRRIDVLILTVDPAMRGISPAFLSPCEHRTHADHRAIRVVANPGEALRLLYRHEPKLLMLWVGRERLGAVATLIEALHLRRPELPLLAIAPEHDTDVERAVRVAGAGYYFALDGDADPPLLRQTLEALGFSNAPVPSGAGPPGDTSPPRNRGQPRAVFRSP